MSNIAENNRRYFDHISDSYDDKPWFVTVNQKVTDHLRTNIDWVGIPFTNSDSTPGTSNVRLLDYACGTGFLSRVYGPYVTVTRGIDISPKMVAAYNSRAHADSLPHPAISATVGDLFDRSNPSPAEFNSAEWKDFDLVTVGFAFHHFEDVVYAAKKLKERLRLGGSIVITDFLEGGDLKADERGEPIEGTEGNWAVHSHGHGHGHHHHAGKKSHNPEDPTAAVREEMNASIVVPHFTLEGVRKIFIGAGFVDVDVVTMKERVYMEFAGIKLWRTILFARGKRPEKEQENSEL